MIPTYRNNGYRVTLTGDTFLGAEKVCGGSVRRRLNAAQRCPPRLHRSYIQCPPNTDSIFRTASDSLSQATYEVRAAVEMRLKFRTLEAHLEVL